MNGALTPEDRLAADRIAGELARLLKESVPTKGVVRRAALERLAYLVGEDITLGAASEAAP